MGSRGQVGSGSRPAGVRKPAEPLIPIPPTTRAWPVTRVTSGSRRACRYSGEGIELPQLVVETVTKRPIEELVRDRVFRPLGVPRSRRVWQPQFESGYANGFDE